MGPDIWFICSIRKVDWYPSFKRVSSMPAPQYSLLIGPSLRTYYRRDYLCIFDIQINRSYFEDLVRLEDEKLMFYLIL